MTKVIIYSLDNKSINLLIPASNIGMTVEDIAKKDVPAGKPYFIIDKSTLPSDHSNFNAWEADFSTPHGYGIGPVAWFTLKYQKEKLEVQNSNTLTTEQKQTRIKQIDELLGGLS